VTSSDRDRPSGAPSRRADDGWARFGAAGRRLARAIAEDRVGPAYLFEGPDEPLCRAAARRFAAGLLCTAPRETRPCDACSACRRAASGSHPDLHLQGRDKATVISVEAMEPLLARAHLAPLEGARQAFVVEPADALAPEGVARYLKTLEEPPLSSTFLLVTARPDRLPDAVVSRCQRVRLDAPGEAEVARALEAEGVPAERARAIARVAGASTARAARIAAAGIDEVASSLVAAALGRAPSCGSAGEAAVERLRRRAAPGARADEGASDAPPAPAGETLREALDDLFHVLQSLARDRVAGRPAGPLDAVPQDVAAEALAEWSRIAPFVRRNVTPAMLAIEAAACLRRAASAPA
jgi:hypothetical protein